MQALGKPLTLVPVSSSDEENAAKRDRTVYLETVPLQRPFVEVNAFIVVLRI
jgi:hypothetical protein